MNIQAQVEELLTASKDWELLENNEISIHLGQGDASEIKIVCEAVLKVDQDKVGIIL